MDDSIIFTYFFNYYHFLLSLAVVSLWYKYCTWDFDYWAKQGVPGESPYLFIGTLKPIWKYALEEQDMAAMKKFRNIHGGFVGGLPTLSVSDPELLRQILVKDFAAFPLRRTYGNTEDDDLFGNMLSMMSGDKWKMMVGLVEECLQNLMTSLKTPAENGEPIDFAKKFPLLTIDVVASAAFGMSVNCIDNPDSEFVVKALNLFRTNVKLIYFMYLFPFLLKRFATLISSPFRYFANIANQTIDMRLKNKDFTRKDFLQIMLEAEIPNDETKENLSTDQKKTLTREIIVAQTILFIVAGQESTATTITFMAYELARNQDIQEKLIKEVDDVMTDTKGKLTYEGVASMQYLDKVTSEILRKYPSVVRFDRVCMEDEYNLNGIIIRKGMPIIVPVYAMHHNPEFYPNPNVFDPERFTPEMKDQRNPFTYLPFGAGPRNCIAKRFALLQVKLTMVHMLCNYRFQTCRETEHPIRLRKGIELLQPISVKLALQKRGDQPHFDKTIE